MEQLPYFSIVSSEVARIKNAIPVFAFTQKKRLFQSSLKQRRVVQLIA